MFDPASSWRCRRGSRAPLSSSIRETASKPSCSPAKPARRGVDTSQSRTGGSGRVPNPADQRRLSEAVSLVMYDRFAAPDS